MTEIPLFSVTHQADDGQINVEIHDREAEAVARRDEIIAGGRRALVQHHGMLRIG